MDRAWLKAVLLVAALALAGWLLVALGPLLRVFILSALLAYVLDPLVGALECRGLGRASATATIFAAVLALGALLVALLFPMVVEEALAARENLATGQASHNLGALARAVERPLLALGMRHLDLFERTRAYLLDIGEGLVGFLLDAVSLVATLVLIPFLSFFLVRDSRKLQRGFLAMVPNRFFEFTLNLVHKMDRQLGGYLRGQLLESAIIALLAAGCLGALRIDSFLFLGAFVGLTNLVPYVGPLIGAVPPVFVALMQFSDPMIAVWVAVALTSIQLIDNAVLKPVVVGKSVDLQPLTVIVVVLIGGKLFGVLGMVLSIPVAGFLKVAAHETRINLRKYRFS